MPVIAPFSKPGRFLRGNIHTHSNLSDGALPPAEVLRRYRAAGYDFLSITDHFLKAYDWPLTDVRALCDDGFTTLIGAELHAPRTEMSDLWHIVAVGLPTDFAPVADHEDGPALARRARDAGAFVGIAHPAWYQLSMDDAQTLVDAAHAVEIYNHGCQIMHDKGDGAYMLDGLADKGHALLAYASDDAHFKTPDFGGGWVEVKAEHNTAEAILAALKAGEFYSSQGPRLNHLEVTETEILVECSPAKGILVAGQGYQHAYRFASGITHAALPLAELGRTPWFRVVVIDEQDRRAWSNPVWGLTG